MINLCTLKTSNYKNFNFFFTKYKNEQKERKFLRQKKKKKRLS